MLVCGMVKTIPYKGKEKHAPVGNGLDRSENTEPMLVCGTLKSVPYDGTE